MKQKPITTKQLIAKLLELDPDGNKEIYLECGDDYYSGRLYEDNIEVYDDNTIMFY